MASSISEAHAHVAPFGCILCLFEKDKKNFSEILVHKRAELAMAISDCKATTKIQADLQKIERRIEKFNKLADVVECIIIGRQ